METFFNFLLVLASLGLLLFEGLLLITDANHKSIRTFEAAQTRMENAKKLDDENEEKDKEIILGGFGVAGGCLWAALLLVINLLASLVEVAIMIWALVTKLGNPLFASAGLGLFAVSLIIGITEARNTSKARKEAKKMGREYTATPTNPILRLTMAAYMLYFVYLVVFLVH